MRKTVVCLVLCLVVLVGCANYASTDEVVPNSRVTSFDVICDTGRNIGMYVYAYNRNADSDTSTGYGYAIRMTSDEYEKECTQYEK